jgi:hypothetical protein
MLYENIYCIHENSGNERGMGEKKNDFKKERMKGEKEIMKIFL